MRPWRQRTAAPLRLSCCWCPTPRAWRQCVWWPTVRPWGFLLSRNLSQWGISRMRRIPGGARASGPFAVPAFVFRVPGRVALGYPVQCACGFGLGPIGAEALDGRAEIRVGFHAAVLQAPVILASTAAAHDNTVHRKTHKRHRFGAKSGLRFHSRPNGAEDLLRPTIAGNAVQQSISGYSHDVRRPAPPTWARAVRSVRTSRSGRPARYRCRPGRGRTSCPAPAPPTLPRRGR